MAAARRPGSAPHKKTIFPTVERKAHCTEEWFSVCLGPIPDKQVCVCGNSKKEKGLLPVLDLLQTSESRTSVPCKEEGGSFAGPSGQGGVGEGWKRSQEQVGVDEARHMGDILARFGCVTQGTTQVLPLQASKTACGPENRQEAGGGRDVEVTGYKEHSQWEVGWVRLPYSLCELLVGESSVPKTKRQAVRGLCCPMIPFPPETSRL